jgi:hypothetical protein
MNPHASTDEGGRLKSRLRRLWGKIAGLGRRSPKEPTPTQGVFA